MRFTKALLILCGLFCLRLPEANASATHTVKGVVITPDGTVVPEFTIVVKHLTDKPELFRRLHFKDGKFNIDGLATTKYQLHITAPLFIGAKLTFDFTKDPRDKDYAIIVLHMYRNEPRMIPGAAHTVSLKVLQQKVPAAAQEAYRTAVALHRDGKLDEALMNYGKALRHYPRYLEALTDIGTILLLYNQPDAALIFLRRAQAVDGGDTIVNLNIAVALTEQGDYAGALKLVKDILRAEPHLAWGQYFLAKIQYVQKKYDEAEKHVREAIENDPGLIEALVLMIDISMEQKKYDQAREGLERLREATNNRMITQFINEQLSELGS
jgi:tetratricopeptide (TPR) repeat protein